MRFWKKRESPSGLAIPYSMAADIVSRTGEIYADLVDSGKFVKPASKLPCSVEVAKECCKIAYEAEYPGLTVELKSSYHHVYRELAYFIDDDIYKTYSSFLSIVVQKRMSRESKLGRVREQKFYRSLIAGAGTQMQSKEEILNSLKNSENDSEFADLVILAEVLGYCNATFRSLWDEWAAFANFVAFKHRIRTACQAAQTTPGE